MRPRPVAVLDIEVYINYFLVAVQDVETGRIATFEYPFDLDRLRAILKKYRVVTFNGINYDMPLLAYALTGATTEDLKKASNRIITQNLRPWNFAKEFDVQIEDPHIDHVDLIEVAPQKGSLKLYAGRLGCKSVQNLPIDHEKRLTEEEKVAILEYCKNDLQSTVELYRSLKEQLALRESMSAQYGIDLRSKSDAQIAEAVVKSEIERLTKRKLDKPGYYPGQKFSYTIPPWMEFFWLPILDDIRKAEFIVNDKGSVLMPDALSKRKIVIGNGVYRMGIGGLHSSEQKVCYFADENHVLIDRDVTSYYPAILLNLNLYPKHIGPKFIEVYRNIVTTRLAAKKAGQKTIAESLKICVNGLFGKLGSRYSVVYAPELLIQTTVTGQLALLMLIEGLYEDGIQVVSANTDGVFVRCRKDKIDRMNQIVADWEKRTGFVTEEAQYSALYARDVNNYIAVKVDGYNTKVKGCYGKGLPLQKNPTTPICAEAVIDWLTLGASIEGTIRACRDVRRFLSLRNVTGGAEWRGEPLGKCVRWYYATGVDEAILYTCNKHLVPKTFGAKPLMTIPDTFPDDVDYQWYVQEAENMLYEIGAKTP